jgi:hypothetical protein
VLLYAGNKLCKNRLEKSKKMKNLFALLVIIVFITVNIYAEKVDLNSLSELQPYFQHISAKKAGGAYKFTMHHSLKKHRGNNSFDRTDGINFDDDAMIFEGFDSKSYSKPAVDMTAAVLMQAARSRACDRGEALAYETITVSDLTNQQRK